MSEAAASVFSGSPYGTAPRFGGSLGQERDRISPGTILIIDDEAAIRESLQTLLELEGFQVETSESGEDGLARMADHTFDLILLDFALPDKNGLPLPGTN